MNASRSLLRRIATLPFVSQIPTPAIVNPSLLSLSFSSSSSKDDVFSDVTTEELKQRIDKYLEGDVEAIPEIFEAILARKLSGKHEGSDDEIIKECQSKTHADDSNKATDSDSDYFFNSDDSDDSDDDGLIDSDETSDSGNDDLIDSIQKHN